VSRPDRTLWAAFAALCALAMAYALAACSSVPKPTPETAIRAALNIIEIVCPPETTVGDCSNRVRLWLPTSEANPYVPADAGKE